MEKLVWIGLLLLSVWLVPAADLVTDAGKKYENVEIRKIAAGCVQIRHKGGEATIALEDLPENFIAALSIRQRYALQSLVDIKVGDKVYKKTSINALGNGFVYISHLDGNSKLTLKELPGKYVATFTRKQLDAVNKVVTKKTASAAADNKSTPNKVKKTPDGKEIHIGPRGGRYYINDAGKKVYLRKN